MELFKIFIFLFLCGLGYLNRKNGPYKNNEYVKIVTATYMNPWLFIFAVTVVFIGNVIDEATKIQNSK